jgi:hypothetical protein
MKGALVNTAATVAIFFLFVFCSCAMRSGGRFGSGFTIGMPLQSTATTSRDAEG